MPRREPSRRPPSRLRSAIAARFGVDPRALAALRVALGLLVLADLASRLVHLEAFHTDRGVFPRAALLEHSPFLHHVSLHALSGDTWFQGVLFAIAAGAALMLVVGHRTRFATLLSGLLLGSLLARNPFVLQSGDSLLLLLLFWGLFLPLGARASVDAVTRRAGPRGAVADLASAAILLQVVLIYTVNAVFKLQAGAWLRGEAMGYIFNLSRFTTPLGALLADAPRLLAWLGWAWLLLLIGSFLLVVTVGRARIAVVAVFAAAHLGMLATMRLGLFPLVSLAALLPFLPPRFWDAGARLAGCVGARLGVAARTARSAPAAAAVMAAAPPAAAAVPMRVWEHAAKPTVVALVLLALVLWSGIGLGVVQAPPGVEGAAEQHGRGWAMFADPPRVDVWFVAPGVLATGEAVDALHGAATPWDTPQEVDGPFPHVRWRKFLSFLARTERPDLVQPLAVHLCARWNDGADPPLVAFTLHRIERPKAVDGGDLETRVIAMRAHECVEAATTSRSDGARVGVQAVAVAGDEAVYGIAQWPRHDDEGVQQAPGGAQPAHDP